MIAKKKKDRIKNKKYKRIIKYIKYYIRKSGKRRVDYHEVKDKLKISHKSFHKIMTRYRNDERNKHSNTLFQHNNLKHNHFKYNHFKHNKFKKNKKRRKRLRDKLNFPYIEYLNKSVFDFMKYHALYDDDFNNSFLKQYQHFKFRHLDDFWYLSRKFREFFYLYYENKYNAYKKHNPYIPFSVFLDRNEHRWFLRYHYHFRYKKNGVYASRKLLSTFKNSNIKCKIKTSTKVKAYYYNKWQQYLKLSKLHNVYSVFYKFNRSVISKIDHSDPDISFSLLHFFDAFFSDVDIFYGFSSFINDYGSFFSDNSFFSLQRILHCYSFFSSSAEYESYGEYFVMFYSLLQSFLEFFDSCYDVMKSYKLKKERKISFSKYLKSRIHK